MPALFRFLFLGVCLSPYGVNANLSQEVLDMRSKLRQLEKRIQNLEKRVGETSIPASIDREVQSNVPQQEAASLGWSQGPAPQGKKGVQGSEKESNSPKTTEQINTREDFSDTFLKAKRLLSQGDVQKARALFKGIKPQEPDYPHALYWLGMIALLQDQSPVQAAAYFSKGYQNCEAMPQYHLLSVSLLLKLAHALHLQKKDSAAKIVLGQCQERAQRVVLSSEVQKEIHKLENELLSQ